MSTSEESINETSEEGYALSSSYQALIDFGSSLISGSPFEFSFLDVLDLPLFDLFDDFQWKIFKILICIVLTNLALIGCFWHIYGAKIVEKFMQPTSSARLIEELKNSISELKLPKEHSPRV